MEDPRVLDTSAGSGEPPASPDPTGPVRPAGPAGTSEASELVEPSESTDPGARLPDALRARWRLFVEDTAADPRPGFQEAHAAMAKALEVYDPAADLKRSEDGALHFAPGREDLAAAVRKHTSLRGSP